MEDSSISQVYANRQHSSTKRINLASCYQCANIKVTTSSGCVRPTGTSPCEKKVKRSRLLGARFVGVAFLHVVVVKRRDCSGGSSFLLWCWRADFLGGFACDEDGAASL